MKTGKPIPDKATIPGSVLSTQVSYKQNAPNSLPFYRGVALHPCFLIQHMDYKADMFV